MSDIIKISNQDQTSKLKNIDALGEYAIENTKSRNKSLLEKIFPNAEQRKIISGELKLIETEYEFRKEALIMAKKTQIQALRETCNQYLVQGKAYNRQKTAEFLMESAQKLQTNLDYIFDKFIEKVEQKTEKIAAIKNERLQKKMAEDLDKEIESFIKMKDKLVENFQAIRRSVNFSSYKVYGGTKKSSKPTPNLIPFF